MVLGRLLCLLDRHNPDRNRVRWDGFSYSGHCVRCEATIRRLRQRRWTAHIAPIPTPRISVVSTTEQ